VPILVNLDRGILAREPEADDELQTMREQPDLEVEPDAASLPAAGASAGDPNDAAKSRPALASDDVS
jgi:hypothetical protein